MQTKLAHFLHLHGAPFPCLNSRTRSGASNGYIELLNGEESGLGHAHCTMNDYKGQLEFSSDWMGSKDQSDYEDLMNRALMVAA